MIWIDKLLLLLLSPQFSCALMTFARLGLSPLEALTDGQAGARPKAGYCQESLIPMSSWGLAATWGEEGTRPRISHHPAVQPGLCTRALQTPGSDAAQLSLQGRARPESGARTTDSTACWEELPHCSAKETVTGWGGNCGHLRIDFLHCCRLGL